MQRDKILETNPTLERLGQLDDAAALNRILLDEHLEGLKRENEAKRLPLLQQLDAKAGSHLCTKEVEQLRPTTVSQLQDNDINLGTIVWVTLIQPCFRTAAIQCLGEDSAGRYAQIELNNFIWSHETTEDAQAVFPVGTRLGIKEPYSTHHKRRGGDESSSTCVVRVDNPCNVIVQRPKRSESCESLKEQGDKMCQKKRYECAVELYTSAVENLSPGNDAAKLKHTLHLSRAAARVGCGDYEGALSDCDTVRAANSSDPSGEYNRGLALMGMARYDQARHIFSCLVKNHADDEAYKDQLTIAEAAVLQSRGVYDFMALPFEPASQKETDIATFCGPLCVGNYTASSQRPGMFVTEDVRPGQLLLAERALAYVNESKHADQHQATTTPTDLVLTAHRNPNVRRMLSQLATTGQMQDAAAPTTAEIPLSTHTDDDEYLHHNHTQSPPPHMSARHIADIFSHNALDYIIPPEATQALRKNLVDALTRPSHSFADSESEPPNEALRLDMPLIRRLLQSESESAPKTSGVPSTAELDAVDGAYFAPLHYAVFLENETVAEALLQAKASPNVKDKFGLTPLHHAVGKHNAQGIARMLIKHGADVDSPTIRGITPLLYAVIERNLWAVEMLLRHGADPYIPCIFYNGLSPADVANTIVQKDDSAQSLLFAFKNAGYDPQSPRRPKVRPMSTSTLSKGVPSGYTPLMMAVSEKNMPITKALLDAKVSPNVADIRGLTPLHYAAEFGHDDLVETLITYGADVDAQALQGFTPLHYAMLACRVTTVGVLLRHKANPFICSYQLDWRSPMAILHDMEPSQDVTMAMFHTFKECGYDTSRGRKRCEGKGLWWAASLMNYGVEPNTLRLQIGMMMFVFATEHVSKGAELTACV
jgi:ankyrin repeat protein/tetratricopeptide (TPR) repeat protein